MINYIYQLVAPKLISPKYSFVNPENQVIIRPEYMALCHADQRYYLGQRSPKVMKEKLPMALIHESIGRVVADHTGNFQIGQKVVMIPNQPGEEDSLIYENYGKGGYFLSSGHDGFMQELVFLSPDRVVAYDDIDPHVAVITEFVSVAIHALERFEKLAHTKRERIGIWGDGNLAFTLASVLREVYPSSKIIVVGKHPSKLANYSFVDETYTIDYLPEDFHIDHAFECTGGEGSYYAIEDIIKYISPQGAVCLLGVSENRVPINTRDILEKGLTLVGCSRSGRQDFERALKLMKSVHLQNRLSTIISYQGPAKTIEDIDEIFKNDFNSPFKTVFKWEL